MISIRRWYIFLVCFISLQAATWGVIAALSNLVTGHAGDSPTATAFQISLIVIGLPVFLVHWLWAQNLAGAEIGERKAELRVAYLYGTLAVFLGPIAAATFDLLATFLGLVFKLERPSYFFFTQVPARELIIRDLVTIAVLVLLWIYHQWVIIQDADDEYGASNAGIRRCYILVFSAVGVSLTTLGVINLLRWLLTQLTSVSATTGGAYLLNLSDELSRLIVGLVLWVPFWYWAKSLFVSNRREERESGLRKFYLYAIVLVATMIAVGDAVVIIARLIHPPFVIPTLADFRDTLPILIGTAALWAYHTYVLKGDEALATQGLRQAEIRRLYLYLVGGVGLAAFLIGLSGDISVLIRMMNENAHLNTYADPLSWFTAATIVGLPVWLWHWRKAQIVALAADDAGASERHSVIRKIYLYFYLLVATLSALVSAIYIAYRVLSRVLGESITNNLVSDLGQAIAYCLIAVGVWLYHGYVLRSDGRINQRDQARRLAEINVAVVDTGKGRFGRAVMDGLQRELPGLMITPVGLTSVAMETMGASSENVAIQLNAAQLIVGPSNIAFANAEVAAAVAASDARKLLVPVWSENWSWVGTDQVSVETIIHQTVRAVKQIVTGEEVKNIRPMGIGTMIGVIVGAIVLMNVVVSIGGYLIYFLVT